MYSRTIARASPWTIRPTCCFCAPLFAQPGPAQCRSFNATAPLLKRVKTKKKKQVKWKTLQDDKPKSLAEAMLGSGPRSKKVPSRPRIKKVSCGLRIKKASCGLRIKKVPCEDGKPRVQTEQLKRKPRVPTEQLEIQTLVADSLKFEAVKVDKPPVPMLSYGLDRVLFNPGVYLLQDPRSRVFNFDPYLEKVMPVNEFNFEALGEYKTSSKDQDLLNLTKQIGTKFTGSTSSMSSILQHFHFLLSNFRDLNHSMLSRGFPDPSARVSRITAGPSAVFLRYKDGIYAIDADKTHDRPNIMSWLGHSLEKFLTTDRSEFELFRRSSPDKAPAEDASGKCYHYSRQGNLLMRSQLDAYDPRLPGSGIFDLKTRAVVSIRMDFREYEKGTGYQLRFAHGEWQSFEREFYDMTRATLLKYTLQVRMGRMDGIFIAFHNVKRIFGFQYLPLADMDNVLHGQSDTTLGDQEFRLSLGLLDELLRKATAQFPETSIRLHFETRNAKQNFMYVFAEPVTEEQADEIQSAGDAAQKEFARTVVGLDKDESDVQQAWQSIQEEVEEQLNNDGDDVVTAESESEPGTEGEAMVQDEVSESESGTEGEATVQDEVSEAKEDTEEEDVDQKAAAEQVMQPGPENNGPLMGWTLSIRNMVNGGYVVRPNNFGEHDDWKIEYHIQEISEKSRWRLYQAMKERRRKLIGMEDQDVDERLRKYRERIHRFSASGREWRAQQDKKNEELGIELYKPLGPGSESMRGREDL